MRGLRCLSDAQNLQRPRTHHSRGMGEGEGRGRSSTSPGPRCGQGSPGERARGARAWTRITGIAYKRALRRWGQRSPEERALCARVDKDLWNPNPNTNTQPHLHPDPNPQPAHPPSPTPNLNPIRIPLQPHACQRARAFTKDTNPGNLGFPGNGVLSVRARR